MTSLLRANAEYASLQLAATFEPQMGFAKKLPNAAESVNKKAKMLHWGAGLSSFTLRSPERKFIYHFDFQGVHCQTLGLDPWVLNLSDHAEAFLTAFHKMEVNRLKSLSLKITVQIPLEMIHAELAELVIESYVLNPRELESTYGNLEDLSLHVYGRRNGIKSVTQIIPQTGEQAKATFLGLANLDTFVEAKFVDTRVHEHLKRISRDCLTIMVEISKEDAPLSAFRSFLEEAFGWTEKIVEETVLRIRGIDPKGGDRNGDIVATS